MKKLSLFILLISSSIYLFSQDIIITTDNERIEAKILFEYDMVIKYALYNNQNGNTFIISKEKIKTLTYQNGKVATFDNEKKAIKEYNNALAENSAGDSSVRIKPKPEKNPEKIFKNVIRINFGATAYGATKGVMNFNFLFSRYLSPHVAIPFEFEIVANEYLKCIRWALMTGIEAVPVTHRQKSGLFINALVGVVVYPKYWSYFQPYTIIGVAVNVNIGYQLVTKSGFVFNAAAGPMYDFATKLLYPRVIAAVGLAFTRQKQHLQKFESKYYK